MRNTKRKFLCMLLVLLLCFIWGNSMLPASSSSALSQWVKDVVNALFGQLDTDITVTSHSTLRKFAHATEFAMLGIVIAGLLEWNFKKNCHLFLLAGILVAFFDETIQLFVEGRAAQVSDVWIDLGGFFFGGLLAFALGSLWRRWHTKNNDNNHKPGGLS